MALAASSASAQEPPSTQTAAPQLDELRTRVQMLEASSGLEPGERTRTLDLYRRAMDSLTAAERDRVRAREYADSLAAAPAEITRVQQALEEPPAPQPVEATGSLADLEHRLLNEQSELARLRGLFAGVKTEAEAEMQLDPATMLTEATREEETVPAVAEPAAAAAGVLEARRAVAAAAGLARGARTEATQQQLLSREVRLKLLELRQRLLNREIAQSSERVAALQAAVNAARQSKAGATALRTEALAGRLDEQAAAPLRTLADKNAALAALVAQLTARTEALGEERQQLAATQERLGRQYDNLTRQLAIAGAQNTAALGAAMLRQRQSLLGSDVSRRQVSALDEEVTQARLEQLSLEYQLLGAVEESKPARSLDPSQSQEPDSLAEDSLAQELHAEHLRLMEDAAETYWQYVTELTATRNDARQLRDRRAEYKQLLDRRLFWIPSAEPLTSVTWRKFLRELSWLTGAPRWRETLADTAEHARNSAAWVLIAGLTLVLMLRSRHRLIEHVEKTRHQVGNVTADSMRATWTALLGSLLLAMPGTLLMATAGWLVGQRTVFASQLSQGLFDGAALYFLLASFHQISRPKGLAEAHFGWRSANLAVLRRSLPRLTAVLVPITVVLPIVDGANDGGHDVLSRVVFAAASLSLALFIHRALRPECGLLTQTPPGHERAWNWVHRRGLHPVAVALPLLLLALSLYGYHFTALQLQSKLFLSACLVATSALVFFLVDRALSVTERRMELERRRAERKAEHARASSRQAADSAGEGVPDVLEVPEADLETINSQTRAFVMMLVVAGTLLVLGGIWSEVLPALAVLEETTLWAVTNSEGTVLRAVSLGGLLIALLVVVLTFFAARNLPGSLEVSVLRRLRLAPGTGYAVTTILKYAIVLVGVTLVLHLLGAEWSKLQWLVAALGVGLGFGLQEIVANFVSGLLILFERPIRVGDIVTVGGHSGTVSRIRIRATTLTDWDRKEQIIPNKVFISEQLTNWTLSDPITRLIVRVGVAYGTDVEEVHRILSAVAADNPRVVAEPPTTVFFVGFGDSSLNFEMRVFIRNVVDMMPLTHELHVQINRELKSRGIEIPFPKRDLYIRQAGPSNAS